MRFELEDYHRNVSDEELIADLKHIAGQIGDPSKRLTWRQYKQSGKFGPETVRRRFDTWNEALEQAGLNPSKQGKYSELELFENIESVWRYLGRQPRTSDMKTEISRISPAAYERHFGRWRKAPEAFVEWINSDDTNTSAEPVVANNGRRTSRQPSLRLRFKVLSRDSFTCQACGKSPATHQGVELQVDHIVAWSNGGETELGNLQALCTDCNQGKSNL